MKKYLCRAMIFVLGLLLLGCGKTGGESTNSISVLGEAEKKGVQSTIKEPNVLKLEYLLQLPSSYDYEPNKKWPLILFLHGAGEVGGTLDDLKKMANTHSIPKAAATRANFPFIAVSPLCPANREWTDLHQDILHVLDEVMEKYHIDADRVYLTGLSMGGGGTWSLAMEHPDKFAAIAPVCGYGDVLKVNKIKNLPVWAFHGAKDDVIDIRYEQVVVDALEKAGGDVKFTIYSDVAHDAWVKAYETAELYDWFLQHSRNIK